MEDYDVSPYTGFLPSEFPLDRLPQAYYNPWEDLAAVLPSLILTKRLRSLVDKIPVLSINRLTTAREHRRAYVCLSFLVHGYIWNVDQPTDRLPKQLAEPYLAVSELLELPPVATYAAVCLWNFKPIVPVGTSMAQPENWDLDNLMTINTYTGSIDESWFYLVSVYFEYMGAFCVAEGLKVIQAARDDDIVRVIAHLQSLAESIDKLGSVLMRMEEMCDPHAFYFRIRPFLAGWKGMKDAGLANGVYYGNEETPRMYSGGSNAQSSLIQALDILLDVKHYTTGQRPTPNAPVAAADGESNFIHEMREYMPGPHTRFLEHLDQVANIRAFVMKHSAANSELILSYDSCLAMLKAFRDKHIQIVTRYIIIQAQLAARSGSSSTLRSGLAKSKDVKDAKGTGGTSLLPFLKQCRDETGDPAAGNWGKRILSDGPVRMSLGVSKLSLDEK
ncbi:hypothetical protein BABINDRAFT_159729 [Babjeviella inositovora NRRL Y-12698]|uniref:Indoleamine 2,3-dioxygenase n=1 Tax=Babjeviella inositovora NRRL Y-12698 TaxID=984486 RepID=A0A1E3QUS3_9ASCO|nr:uncharacterized protein BABINDRAFT_159729 [Babjeviella inositovora NRRL Y-12698]ODQ81436.1 hypothetical protein BABINDRAFT_159729 [Babjeviella inositovora NRRL Y-12698]